MNDEQTQSDGDNHQGIDSDSQQKLSDVKRRALDALTPVLSNIEDMSPERKFDICLSAMRFTDNAELAEPALEAALKIEEAGTKAEALVELINEINYLEKA